MRANPARLDADRRHRSVLVRGLFWLLILLVPAQATAATWLGVRGPAHQHRLDPVSPVVLDDLRRAPLAVPARDPTLVGHGHAHAEVSRHHHAAGDASVLPIDDPVVEAAEGDDRGASPTAAFVVAPPAGHTAWRAEPAVTARAGHFGWTPSSHDPEPSKRPPREAA